MTCKTILGRYPLLAPTKWDHRQAATLQFCLPPVWRIHRI